MPPLPNRHAADDPRLDAFVRHLLAERNVAENTRVGYLRDLSQLVASKFGPEAVPPYDWSKLNDEQWDQLLEDQPQFADKRSK